jgi:hypothetical protein
VSNCSAVSWREQIYFQDVSICISKSQWNKFDFLISYYLYFYSYLKYWYQVHLLSYKNSYLNVFSEINFFLQSVIILISQLNFYLIFFKKLSSIIYLKNNGIVKKKKSLVCLIVVKCNLSSSLDIFIVRPNLHYINWM